jgi:hypothetical protein
MKFLNNKIPKKKTLYAVTAGDLLGKFLLFIEPTDNNTYHTLAIGEGREINSGGFSAIEIPLEAITEGLKNKILEKVEKLPKSMYNILYLQWKHEREKNEFNN